MASTGVAVGMAARAARVVRKTASEDRGVAVAAVVGAVHPPEWGVMVERAPAETVVAVGMAARAARVVRRTALVG